MVIILSKYYNREHKKENNLTHFKYSNSSNMSQGSSCRPSYIIEFVYQYWPQKEFSWSLLASRFHSAILTIQTPTDPIRNTMTKQNYVKCQEISKTQTSDSFVFVQTLIVQFLWAVWPCYFTTLRHVDLNITLLQFAVYL